MKALILNSGMGTRMGVLTSEHPKCMTEVSAADTILSRQLKQLASVGIHEAVITTGLFDSVLVGYCNSLNLPLHYTFVKNPDFRVTNYIYSIYCAREVLDDDILLMHGDLVFENAVLDAVLASETSCMAVSSTLPLPEKDFKAVIEGGKITKVGIEFFTDAMAAQPLYLLKKRDWRVWLDEITRFVEAGTVKCYAENALNQVSDRCDIRPLDVGNRLCAEIDNPEDLAVVSSRVAEVENRTVYLAFSTDVIHSGHIAIIRKAARLGKVIIGVLTDEAVISYKRYPLLPFSERKAMFESISGVWKVVPQDALSYRANLEKFRPDIVVHGDDWLSGFQRPIRDEVVSVLAEYGGRLVEYPYAKDDKFEAIEKRTRAELAMPDLRRRRLRRAIALKGTVSAMEAHSGLTGLLVEKTVVYQQGEARQFDALWVSSLCDSTAKGKPDIELVDMTSRIRTVDDILEVTTKPVIFDGGTGGLTEHFVYTVRTLERMGVSMIVIEDRNGLKKDGLSAGEEDFCAKIRAGKKAQKTREFMICAGLGNVLAEQGQAEALRRALAFAEAGADAILIRSGSQNPEAVFAFAEAFRAADTVTPLAIVPTSLNTVTEEEFKARGVNVIIYADQLTRTGFPAMQKAAEMILEHHRAKECDDLCMPIGEIIRLIPEEE